MPKLETVQEISEAEAIAHLSGVLDSQYTRFGEGDAVRLNRRATPRPGDRAGVTGVGLDGPAETVIPPALKAVLRRGTVGVISDYHGCAPWQGRGREQDIYSVLLLGADGHGYEVWLPDNALMAYQPRMAETPSLSVDWGQPEDRSFRATAPFATAKA